MWTPLFRVSAYPFSFFWLEKSRDKSPATSTTPLPDENPMSSSRYTATSIPFSSSQLHTNHLASSIPSASGASAYSYASSPASLLFAHHNQSSSPYHTKLSHRNTLTAITPPTPSLLASYAANQLFSTRRLRLIASMFSQMCEAVAICHDFGVSHRDIKPENFICCDSTELEIAEGEADVEIDDEANDGNPNFGPQAKRKVVVKLTDFGLSTTLEECSDVECGSKPYMSYGASSRTDPDQSDVAECRNNLGPSYRPGPSDVWSLGIVFFNMLLHRNPWKDPTDGDLDFESYIHDPVDHLQSKGKGLSREVASFLATRVLCLEVDDRVSAREFGKWIKALPEMMNGRQAMKDVKSTKLDKAIAAASASLGGKSEMFVKSPVRDAGARKSSASALTESMFMSPPLATSIDIDHASHADVTSRPFVINDDEEQTAPTRAGPRRASSGETNGHNLATPDLEGEELKSATTYDDQVTPLDTATSPSPDATSPTSPLSLDGLDDDPSLSGSRSPSTHKRRKRGVRKGKGAQVALALSSTDLVTRDERDTDIRELTAAAQDLARDLSKKAKPFDPTRDMDFPPLGTTPAEVAAKKSRLRSLLKGSGNPQLQALAQRVADRSAGSGANWSAPAQLEVGSAKGRAAIAAATVSVGASDGPSSALSSFGQISESSVSSVSAVHHIDDDWRKRDTGLETDSMVKDHTVRGRHNRRDEDMQRARKAALAAAALTGNMAPMGSFGKPFPMASARPPEHTHAARPTIASHASQTTITKTSVAGLEPPSSSASTITKTSMSSTASQALSGKSSVSSMTQSGANEGDMPNKPKLKGQIQTLAKMLTGLKTSGKSGKE